MAFRFALALGVLTTQFWGTVSLECKCSPGEPCWPSPSEWDSLNMTVSGRLIRTVLPASVCYTDEPNYDLEACDRVIASWTTNSFHSDDPASIHNPAKANNSCNPIYSNGTSTAGDPLAEDRGCDIGPYPRFVVNATEVAHVQAAMKFVDKHNLRLIIKNTGHSGKPIGAGGLSIWTHHMKQMQLIEDFQPRSANGTTSCSESSAPQKILRVGAGVQDNEVFQAAAQYDLAVVGGTNSDVGLVGWATGGGHGYLTSEFGQGADNIVEATVVTPRGEVLTANACQNSDLLWAIRGGGGGTFGLITELGVQAHPMPQVTAMVLSVSKTGNSTSSWWALMAGLHAHLPDLKTHGVTSYYTIAGPPSYEALTFYGVFFVYNKPNGTIETAMQPLLSFLDGANGTATFQTQTQSAPKWISLFDKLPSDGSAAGGGGSSASRLLPASSLTDDMARLAEVLELIGPTEHVPQTGVSNPSIAGSMSASSKKVDDSLNPAWRDAVVHLLVKDSWSDALPYPQALAAQSDMTNLKGAALRSLAPNSGTYFNEADASEPDWQRSFWGDNYEKLRQIKEKYDPHAMQWCEKCVGTCNSL
ncbi:fad binding domain protein [Alternaria burnsii]|uniref:Fad binding domain protein n=1 Tax=Alternaria burnsii TaxID=1187904 RepID=A0A8H7ECH9_9PLEO|nr:fad binding domain protein [Alternaria burnsii]KAF7672571.1 fad binding domain protein [Alternaria burnsii]